MAETDTVTHFDDDTEPARAEPPSGLRGRRTALVVCAVVVVAAVAVVGALGLGGGEEKNASAPPRAGSVVPVTRTTLTERTDVDGQLGFGTEIPLPVKATGTVTWLPQQGATAERGDTLLRVDDRPVVLLYGSMPMYRDLGLTATATGSGESGAGAGAQSGAGSGGASSDVTRSDTGAGTAPSASPAPDTGTGTGGASGGGTGSGAPVPLTGMDVLQFETNLAALGYTGFTVDEKYTAATVRAVKRWQKSLGLAETGTVGVGDVIYSAGKVRIGQPGARLGSAVGEDTLTYTGTARKVVVNASAADAGWAVRGTVVGITLPDGKSVRGEVASVGRQADAPEGGNAEGESGAGAATLPVTIAIADQKSVGRLESGPVTVEYVGREAKDVLSVPVAALVALAEGGHGLETEDGRFVAVRTGLFADGNVQVSGSGVSEGMKVRIPE